MYDFGSYSGSLYQKMNGVKLIYSEACLEDTDVRTFPISKHRSARIKKKLIKKFGSEYVKKPCIFQINGVLYAHPNMKAEIERRLCNG